jgi:hypothetical protein
MAWGGRPPAAAPAGRVDEAGTKQMRKTTPANERTARPHFSANLASRPYPSSARSPCKQEVAGSIPAGSI